MESYRKFLALLIFFTLILNSAVAISFGSLTYQNTKTIEDLTTSFTLGFTNTGNETLRLEMEVQGGEEVNVSLPENVTIPPTPVTKDPEGDNWHYLGDGEYVKVVKVPFDVKLKRERESEDARFEVRIEAYSMDREEESGSQSRIAQVREYSYTVKTGSPAVAPKEEDSGLSSLWKENSSLLGQGNKKADRQQKKPEKPGSSKDSNTSRTSELVERGKKGIDGVTVILITGVLVSAVYLWRVV